MIDPNDIVAELVALLQDIPDLVTAMGGDATKIVGYFETSSRLDLAIYQMVPPGIMVAYQGLAPARFGGFDVWAHQLSIAIKLPVSSSAAALSGYYEIFRLIVKGMPTSAGQEMQYIQVNPSCDPMDTPTMRRQTDAQGVDYFEVSMTFTEIGDN